MSTKTNERRPRRATEGDEKTFGSVTNDSTESDPSARYTLAELDDLAAHVGGTWVVAVYRGGGRYLVRTYVNTRSARRAAYRARARGQAVRVVLAELKPVWTLDLPEDEGVAQ